MMTIREFLTLTCQWLIAECKTGKIKEAIEKFKSIINITEEEAKRWWRRAKWLTLRATAASFVIFLTGALIGGYYNLGWPNSVAGLLIAPILFILLAWWTPLVAIVAVIYEITHKGIGDLTEVALAQAKWWLGFTCGALLWQVVISLGFTFIPYWNALSRIPVIILLALAMTLMSIRWGGITWYRATIKTLVVLMFIIQVAVCFIPSLATLATASTSRLSKNIQAAANTIEKDGFFSTVAKPASTLQPGFETMPVGVHHFTVNKTTTDWIKIPGNAYWDLAPIKDGNWKLITFEGEVVTYKEGQKKYGDFPGRTMIFKIQTDEELGFILKVKSA